MYSHKFKKAALKYEIAIDIFRSIIVWIYGPHRGGKHDKVIYFERLRDLIPAGKKAIVDRVYGSKASAEDFEKLAMPSACDDPTLSNFKARVIQNHNYLVY